VAIDDIPDDVKVLQPLTGVVFRRCADGYIAYWFAEGEIIAIYPQSYN